MGRPARFDYPGALHHVVNRGPGHNPIFASDEDVGRFLSLLSLVTREGLLRVLSYSVLSTHFHLIVESPTGNLPAAMQRVEQLFALWFNRTRERDGHTFKGRYFSRLIQDDIHLACATGYVDKNAVDAGMAESPGAYPHGSARYYLGEPSPRWLSRDRLEELACRVAGITRFRAEAYIRLWQFAWASGGGDIVRRASESRGTRIAPLQVLIRAGSDEVQRWLLGNLYREEGRAQPCLVVAGAELIRRLDAEPGDLSPTGDRGHSLDRVAGLLHALSGWTMSETAIRFRVSQPTIQRAVSSHRHRMQEDPSYCADIARFVAATISAVYGGFYGSPVEAPPE